MNEPLSDHARPKPVSSLRMLAVNLFWMLFGPAVLLAILYVNATEDKSWFSGTDFAFFVVSGLVILARWLDQRSGQCTLSDGQTSTWKDCKRFQYVFVFSALLGWAVSNVIGNYFT